MRMWMVPPNIMCNSHLLGEHREMHTFVGTILKTGKLGRGYFRNGLCEVHNIRSRHDALVAEMDFRGMRHRTPLKDFPVWTEGVVDKEHSFLELVRRCPNCLKRIYWLLEGVQPLGNHANTPRFRLF